MAEKLSIDATYNKFGPRIAAMDILLPSRTPRLQQFLETAHRLKICPVAAREYIFLMLGADIDVYDSMCTDRMEMLIEMWDMFQHATWPLSAEDEQIMGKSLLHHTLQVWFSEDWKNATIRMRRTLLDKMNNNLAILPLVEGLFMDELYGLDIMPWNTEYLNNLFTQQQDVDVSDYGAIEPLVPVPVDDDIFALCKEDLPLIFLRLMKLFDSRFMDDVKILATRTLAAWNSSVYQANRTDVSIRVLTKHTEKDALLSICHIFLMVIYEADDQRGYKIDNLINKVRFFIDSFNEVAPGMNHNFAEYTATRYIGLTCHNLHLSSDDFLEKYALENCGPEVPTLYGVISQAYISYLLGHVLLDYSVQKFDKNRDITKFSNVFRCYVEVRERSELFIQAEMRKHQLQIKSHNLNQQPIKFHTHFANHINKGNHFENLTLINLHSHENIYNTEEPTLKYLPENEQLHQELYEIFINSTHKGWYLAKVMLLLHIISLKWNEIEMFRYQPGLTTEFMLNLDVNMSKYFADLALILEDHPLIAQEFWLTAFYLNPTEGYYKEIQRAGLRNKRISQEIITKDSRRARRDKRFAEQIALQTESKYELFSSTVDVHEIVNKSDYKNLNKDYAQLVVVLQSLKLPEDCVMDLMNICFAARSQSLAWAVKWPELQKRCKDMLKIRSLKRRAVEQNMAEANERLKYLHIDYEKYKHRPMLEYGYIELGYEHGLEQTDLVEAQEEEVERYEEDFETSDDDYQEEQPASKRRKEEEEHIQRLNALDDSHFAGGRRTRARTKSALKQTLEKEKIESETLYTNAQAGGSNQPVRTLSDEFKASRAFHNNTPGFKPIPNIWTFTPADLESLKPEYELITKICSFFDLENIICSAEGNDSDCSSPVPSLPEDFEYESEIDECEVNIWQKKCLEISELSNELDVDNDRNDFLSGAFNDDSSSVDSDAYDYDEMVMIDHNCTEIENDNSSNLNNTASEKTESSEMKSEISNAATVENTYSDMVKLEMIECDEASHGQLNEADTNNSSCESAEMEVSKNAETKIENLTDILESISELPTSSWEDSVSNECNVTQDVLIQMENLMREIESYNFEEPIEVFDSSTNDSKHENNSEQNQEKQRDCLLDLIDKEFESIKSYIVKQIETIIVANVENSATDVIITTPNDIKLNFLDDFTKVETNQHCNNSNTAISCDKLSSDESSDITMSNLLNTNKNKACDLWVELCSSTEWPEYSGLDAITDDGGRLNDIRETMSLSSEDDQHSQFTETSSEFSDYDETAFGSEETLILEHNRTEAVIRKEKCELWRELHSPQEWPGWRESVSITDDDKNTINSVDIVTQLDNEQHVKTQGFADNSGELLGNNEAVSDVDLNLNETEKCHLWKDQPSPAGADSITDDDAKTTSTTEGDHMVKSENQRCPSTETITVLSCNIGSNESEDLVDSSLLSLAATDNILEDFAEPTGSKSSTIDSSTSKWQPSLKLPRLRVINGLIIRDCSVRVERLNLENLRTENITRMLQDKTSNESFEQEHCLDESDEEVTFSVAGMPSNRSYNLRKRSDSFLLKFAMLTNLSSIDDEDDFYRTARPGTSSQFQKQINEVLVEEVGKEEDDDDGEELVLGN